MPALQIPYAGHFFCTKEVQMSTLQTRAMHLIKLLSSGTVLLASGRVKWALRTSWAHATGLSLPLFSLYQHHWVLAPPGHPGTRPPAAYPHICPVPPVVQDAVDHHPLGLDAIAVEPLLHLCVVRVFVLPFLPLAVLVSRAIIKGWWLIHVVLPLVVAVHHGVVELQLQQDRATSPPGLPGAAGRAAPALRSPAAP